jgi:lipid-binding SYLF domain-containing protein
MKIRVLTCALLCTALGAFAQDKEDDRLKNSYTVLKEILATPDKGIPHDLLNKSECVIVYPSVLKAAFIVGGSYGRGVITAVPAKTTTARGALPRCLRSKAAASACKLAARPRISSCW